MHTNTFIAAFAKGYSTAFKYPGLFCLKWLLNLIFAISLILPLSLMATSDWRHSIDAPALQGDLTVNQIAEFVTSRIEVLTGLGLAVIPLILMIVFVSLAINGAIIKVYLTKRRHAWSQFIGFCWSYLPSMLVIGFIALIFFVAIVGGVHGLSTEVIDRGAKALGSPSVKFYATWLELVVVIVLLSWLSRVYDTARILVCESRDRKPIRAFLKAIHFVNTHHWGTLFLWLLFMAVLVMFSLLYGWAKHLVPLTNLKALLITFALGQALVFFRAINGLATLGGFMAYMDGRLEANIQPQSSIVESKPDENYLGLDPQSDGPI